MSPTNQPDRNHEDDFFCANCLTELERGATRCYRCNHFFHGASRSDLMRGKPHIVSVLYYG